MMQLEASLTTAASVGEVLAHVDDLGAYPAWMPLVHTAVRVDDASEPTWDVELRARVGPFARSKRLRMVRAVYERADLSRIVFERREIDERQHAMWRLTVAVAAAALKGDTTARGVSGGGAELVMRLYYDGRLFVSVVEAILRQNIDAGRDRLAELLRGGT
jgi:hypothetical protein